MAAEIDNINMSMLLDVLRNELNSYEDDYPDLPTLELCGVWINGSLGGGKATENSDIDLTVEIGVFQDEYEMRALYVANKITGVSGQFTNALIPVLPMSPDVTVIPSQDIIDEADLDAPSAEEHVIKTQKHGGYKTAFNARSEEYIRVV